MPDSHHYESFSPLTSWLPRYCNIRSIAHFYKPLIFSIFRYKQMGLIYE